jgi:hypothetical protein
LADPALGLKMTSVILAPKLERLIIVILHPGFVAG